jgi:hypothetical protein
MRALRAVVHHPAVNLVVALILIATSMIEIWESLTSERLTMGFGAMEMEVGVQQGVLAYGLVNLLRAIPEFFEGVERGVGR